MSSKTLFDPRCYELATAFLEGSYDTEENRVRLAQYIQISIESELFEIERENTREGKCPEDFGEQP